MAAFGGFIARQLLSPRRRLLDAQSPMLQLLAQMFALDVEESYLLGEVDGHPIELQVFSDKGDHLKIQVIAPIRCRIPVKFLVSRRDPRGQQGAPIGIPHLDRYLQVFTTDTRIPEDFSWLSGQMMPIGGATNAPWAVRFLTEKSVAAGLMALIPGAREGSRVNAAAVTLIEKVGQDDTSLRKGVQALLTDAAMLAASIESAADSWSVAITTLGLTAGPYTEQGDRELSGERSGLRIRASVISESDDAVHGVEVDIGPVDPGVSVQAGAGGIALRNIILDGRICVASDEPEWVQEALSAPDAAAELMAVFGPWPTSSMEAGTLCVRAQEMVDGETLIEMIRSGLACAARLSRPAS